MIRINDYQFLAANVSEFRTEVLCDLSIEELYLMFGNRFELAVLIHQRFIDWRESVEADEEQTE